LSATETDRRSGSERRSTTFAAYWHGARNPRRRDGRRATDRHYPIVDWYSPRLLIPVFTILVLCVLDGLLTVTLMKHGASEMNPVMALFLPHNLYWFAFVKLALTGMGLCVLVACSRMKLFRRIPGEAFVYAVLGLYMWLIVYELRLLELAATQST
jgi:Domain of unknown function (DUF5658)